MYLILGDSHAGGFSQLKIPKEIVIVPGATASGLNNPNSSTNAYNIFNTAIKSLAHTNIITMLGEVDTGFVIWYRHQFKGISVKESLEITINRYCKWLSEIKSKLIVVSAPQPTIRDGELFGAIANLRREIKASQAERTALTIEFNIQIESFCKSHMIKYINLDPFVLDENNRLKECYYNTDRRNHHYNKKQFARLLSKVI